MKKMSKEVLRHQIKMLDYINSNKDFSREQTSNMISNIHYEAKNFADTQDSEDLRHTIGTS